jgi:hypothetical protein
MLRFRTLAIGASGRLLARPWPPLFDCELKVFDGFAPKSKRGGSVRLDSRERTIALSAAALLSTTTERCPLYGLPGLARRPPIHMGVPASILC